MKELVLTGGSICLVDDEDYVFLSQWKWQLGKDGYARRTSSKNGKHFSIRMARLIANTPEDMEVDHINGNRLDNRKANLRNCTRRQNSWNIQLKKYNMLPGVRFRPQVGSYKANRNQFESFIRVDGKQKSLGRFASEIEAHNAYLDAIKKHRGEYANVTIG